jgi:signal-transduction protein with cAMP-binding, CBS, and nucleotidyltransferase domain
MEMRELLKNSPMFSCLTSEALEALIGEARLRNYRLGQYLAHAGAPWPMLFFLVNGSISAVKESPEGRSLVATSARGKFFGEFHSFILIYPCLWR